MSSRWLVVCLVGLAGPVAWASGDQKGAPAKGVSSDQKTASPEPLVEQIVAFRRQHQDRERKFCGELRAARHDDKKVSQANQEYQEFVRTHAGKLIALIKAHGKEPAVFERFLVLLGEYR